MGREHRSTPGSVCRSPSSHFFSTLLEEVIDRAKYDGWLLDLVAAALERPPKNAALRELAEGRGLTVSGPRVNNKTGKPLEALIRDNAKFINPTLFKERLPQMEGQVC